MKVHEIFTPDNYPEHTYIERGRGEHEQNLKFELQGPASIVSISGPSKSGKSVLMNNAVHKLNYHLVTVHGSNIDSVRDLWENTLDQINAPDSRTITNTSEEDIETQGSAGISVPGLKAGTKGTNRDRQSTQETKNQARRGLKQVVDLVALDKFVLYIDDAHYIDEQNHANISESIKDAYERGMTICVAYIPYRSDDLTRANPDLSGRIESISIDYWDTDDLTKIAETGFELLNRYPSDLIVKNLARESIGSPHLMQKLCLELCKYLNVVEPTDKMEPLDARSNEVVTVLRKTADNFYHDYSTVLELLNGDISEDRNSRKKFDYQLTGKGDVYDVLLNALASNPPKKSFDRTDIIERVETVCHDETPQSGNIVQTIQRIDRWISEKTPENDYCFDWVSDRNTLEIPDPYLIFCLRWSDITDISPNLN